MEPDKSLMSLRTCEPPKPLFKGTQIMIFPDFQGRKEKKMKRAEVFNGVGATPIFMFNLCD